VTNVFVFKFLNIKLYALHFWLAINTTNIINIMFLKNNRTKPINIKNQLMWTTTITITTVTRTSTTKWGRMSEHALKPMTHKLVSGTSFWYQPTVTRNWYRFLVPVGITH